MSNTLIRMLAGMLLVAGCGEVGAQIQLAWDPNTEPDLAGYELHYGTVSGIYDQALDVGMPVDVSAPSFVLDGLTTGTPYFIVVTAYDTSGIESAYSNEATGQAR